MAIVHASGGTVKHQHLPYFYSDLFDLDCEAIGAFGADMNITEGWMI